MADIDDSSWFGKLPHQLCAILPHIHLICIQVHQCTWWVMPSFPSCL